MAVRKARANAAADPYGMTTRKTRAFPGESSHGEGKI
jgi:hypothetical protein